MLKYYPIQHIDVELICTNIKYISSDRLVLIKVYAFSINQIV